MAINGDYLFDGNTSQWSRLGYAERRLLDETGLTVIMHHDMLRDCGVLSVYEPKGDVLIEKSFSHWSIDSASDWLAKLCNDYASWR